MRKLASFAASGAMVASGLIGGTAVQATAAPYPGSVDTVCYGNNINNPRVGNPVKVKLRVGTHGEGAARGWATFTYHRKKNDLIVAEFRRRYVGPEWNKYSYRRKIPRGRYNVHVWFNSTPGDSVYQNCRDTFSQRVRRRR